MTATITLPQMNLRLSDNEKLSTVELRLLMKHAKALLKWKKNLPNLLNEDESVLIPAWNLPEERWPEWQDALWQWHFWHGGGSVHPLSFEMEQFRKNQIIGLFGLPVIPQNEPDNSFNYLMHYDLFLRYYSAETKKRTATYYTPVRLARFLVQKTLQVISDEFNTDPTQVIWVDFACGTGLFPQLILEETNFNPNVCIYAYENALAPYGLASYHFHHYPNVHVHLSNPLNPRLEDIELWETWKDKTLVVIGNPPWSGISANKSKWILEKIEDYKHINGVSLGEKKYWLQDDYVKFIRLGQFWLENAHSGILAVISNHNYLDNPTFRGMRYSLLHTFDRGLIYDLKGNLKKISLQAEIKDENIFGVETGAATALFVKNVSQESIKQIDYQAFSGTKEEKLNGLHIDRAEGRTSITPTLPYFFFSPQTAILTGKYEHYLHIRELFRSSNIGIISARDKFLIAFEPQVILERLRIAANTELSDVEFAQLFRLKDTSSFSIRKARKALFETDEKEWRTFLLPISYRPLDVRQIFFHPDWVERRVWGTSQHLLQSNVGMVFQRGCSSHNTMNLPQATRHIIDHGFSYPANRAVSYVAPLYFYEGIEQKSNLRLDLLEVRSERIRFALPFESFFYYIFAILHAPSYKEKYATALTMDFPRIPLPPDENTFLALSDIGRRLINFHLLETESSELPDLEITELPCTIEKIKWQNGRLTLSENISIKGLTHEEFIFSLGGYEGIKKYLNSHKKRLLLEENFEQIKRALCLIRNLPHMVQSIDELVKSWI